MKSPSGGSLGRFELRRELGKGAQATVWLAYDPRLEREVAVKLLNHGSSTAAVDQWLQEARSVSRLNHPSIVPVFEADVHNQQPYLVFEYVQGPTLTAALRARGALPSREAVEMMVGVLDALHAAHLAGVVHRDLKPSNILIDTNGRARVMDFGIAARTKDAVNQQQVVGTPGYMSPEAAHGMKPTPGMDVFAAGLVLAEMLCGKQLVAEKDPYRAIYRTAHEDLKLPSGTALDGDDALRAIVQRSLARDATKRHTSAAELRDALQQWLVPQPGAQAEGGGKGTLEFLMRRMRTKGDFPALSDSMARIQRVASSEKENLHSLSGEILKDVALTNKLLRVVNSAGYKHAGGGSINTVSRAVALIGFAGIRNMALSLVLVERMHDKGHASRLKEEFLRALMAGSLADELCGVQRDAEEAFISAMFQNLGRLLTEYYFPEEAGQVRSLVKASQGRGADAARVAQEEVTASVSVLGLSFEELGLGVAKAWGLPDTLQRAMRRAKGEPPARLCDKADRVHWLASAANEMTDTLLKSTPDRANQCIAVVAERFSKALGLSVKDMQAATVVARRRLAELAEAMNLHVQSGSPLMRLLEPPAAPPGEAGAVETDSVEHDSLTPLELHATLPVDARAVALLDQQAAINMLAAGIQDITNTLVEDFKLNEVLRMILETMLRALGFHRVIFCLRDAKTDTLTGRFGLGEGVELVAPKFKVPVKPRAGAPIDLFSAVCIKGADTLISDATTPSMASRLPPWYRECINAPAFLLLPLMLKGSPFGLIYADKAKPGGIELGEKELSLLRTLRNQAVMAFKQAS